MIGLGIGPKDKKCLIKGPFPKTKTEQLNNKFTVNINKKIYTR